MTQQITSKDKKVIAFLSLCLFALVVWVGATIFFAFNPLSQELDNTTWYKAVGAGISLASTCEPRVRTLTITNGNTLESSCGCSISRYKIRGDQITFYRRLSNFLPSTNIAGTLVRDDDEKVVKIRQGGGVWHRDKSIAEKEVAESVTESVRSKQRKIVDTETGIEIFPSPKQINLTEERNGADIWIKSNGECGVTVTIPGSNSGRFKFIYKDRYISYFDDLGLAGWGLQ